MARKQVNIRLDDLTIENIKQIASEYRMSESQVITRAIVSLDINALSHTFYSNRSELPKSGAVYFVVDSDETIIYIGRTGNLHSRLYGKHHKKEHFSDKRIYWINSSDADFLSRIEAACIAFFEPELNAVKGSAGRRSSETKVSVTVSITPSDLALFLAINPNLSKALRQVAQEYRERQQTNG